MQQTKKCPQLNPFSTHCISLFNTFSADVLKCYNLDLSKIEMNNQNLLELRSRSVQEEKNLHDTLGEKGQSDTKTKNQFI